MGCDDKVTSLRKPCVAGSNSAGLPDDEAV